MNSLYEDLARAQSLERLERAHHQQRSLQLARARRLARRAERSAHQARLQLSRLL